MVGGVAADEFLASVEQLDSSNKQDVLYQVAIPEFFSLQIWRWDSPARMANGGPGSLGPQIWLCDGSHPNQQVRSASDLTRASNPSLSQAGHKLDMQETLGYNLGKLGTIFTVQIAQLWPDWSTLFLLWELLLFIQRLDTLETHFEWPRNLKLKYFC